MSRFVLDTSVSVSWFFEDEGGDYAADVLESLNTREAVVPETIGRGEWCSAK